jgi:hypothetical protein
LTFYFYFFTGKTPIGELFSPAYDCSKILDHNQEAKDGMYWIDLGGTYPKQVNLKKWIANKCKNLILRKSRLLSTVFCQLS